MKWIETKKVSKEFYIPWIEKKTITFSKQLPFDNKNPGGNPNFAQQNCKEEEEDQDDSPYSRIDILKKEFPVLMNRQNRKDFLESDSEPPLANNQETLGLDNPEFQKLADKQSETKGIDDYDAHTQDLEIELEKVTREQEESTVKIHGIPPAINKEEYKYNINTSEYNASLEKNLSMNYAIDNKTLQNFAREDVPLKSKVENTEYQSIDEGKFTQANNQNFAREDVPLKSTVENTEHQSIDEGKFTQANNQNFAREDVPLKSTIENTEHHTGKSQNFAGECSFQKHIKKYRT